MNKKQLVLLLAKYDKNTYEHVCRTACYANELGKILKLSIHEMNILLYASLLHDIGKILIPTSLLEKTEPLSDEEFNYIKRHVILGVQLLPDTLQEVKDIIVAHHERLDGSGYPNHLKEKEIPKLAKILAIADSYDAMTSNRMYNTIKTPNEAFNDLLSNTIYYGKNKYSYTYVKKFYHCIQK